MFSRLSLRQGLSLARKDTRTIASTSKHPFAPFHSSVKLNNPRNYNDSMENLEDFEGDPSLKRERNSNSILDLDEVLPQEFRASPEQIEIENENKRKFSNRDEEDLIGSRFQQDEIFGNSRNTLGNQLESHPHRLYIKSTRNNTHMTLQDHQGNIFKHFSAGIFGFKNTKKSSYEASYKVASEMIFQIQKNKIQWRISNLIIFLNGFGQGREAVFRALLSNEATEVRKMIKFLADRTPLKIGGNRGKRQRNY